MATCNCAAVLGMLEETFKKLNVVRTVYLSMNSKTWRATCDFFINGHILFFLIVAQPYRHLYHMNPNSMCCNLWYNTVEGCFDQVKVDISLPNLLLHRHALDSI